MGSFFDGFPVAVRYEYVKAGGDEGKLILIIHFLSKTSSQGN
jgi:hypothetical protein